MSVDSKCYELLADAGLEPILQGGRGQASGFVMRMMAENKLKHKGQYRNPSAPNDYNSKMKKWVPFNYKKLASKSQGGLNESEYGASPFITKHFGSPEHIPYVPRSQRLLEGTPIEGETDEQKSSRLKKQAEELLEKAKQLMESTKKKGRVKGFLKGVLKTRQAKQTLAELKKQKKEEADAIRKAEEKEKKEMEEYEKGEKVKGFLAKKVRKTVVAPREARERKVAEIGKKVAIRKLVRFKHASKETLKNMKLPKWWDGVMCVDEWAKATESQKGITIYEFDKRWFGKRLYRFANNISNNPFAAAVVPEVPMPKNWTKAKPEAKKAYEDSREEQKKRSAKITEQLENLATKFLYWVFGVAMPMNGWKVIDYAPREEDFPEDKMFNTSSKAWENVSSRLRISLGGTPQPRHDLAEMKSVKLGPLPPKLKLLVEPSGDWAYLLPNEQSGKEFLKTGDIHLSTKFRKVGKNWEHMLFVYDPKKYDPMKSGGYAPIKVGSKLFKDNNDYSLLTDNPADKDAFYPRDRHIDWAYPEGIAQITESAFKELCDRKKWSGKPLVQIALVGGRVDRVAPPEEEPVMVEEPLVDPIAEIVTTLFGIVDGDNPAPQAQLRDYLDDVFQLFHNDVANFMREFVYVQEGDDAEQRLQEDIADLRRGSIQDYARLLLNVVLRHYPHLAYLVDLDEDHLEEDNLDMMDDL
jgi:hypothetical protein